MSRVSFSHAQREDDRFQMAVRGHLKYGSILWLCFFCLSSWSQALDKEHGSDSGDDSCRDAHPEIQNVPPLVLAQLALEVLFPGQMLPV